MGEEKSSSNKVEEEKVETLVLEEYWFGLGDLWNIAMDDTLTDIQSLAGHKMIELLSTQCFAPQIETYLLQCVNMLKQHRHIVKSLKFFKTVAIRHIWGNMNVPTVQQQHNWELIKSIVEKYDL